MGQRTRHQSYHVDIDHDDNRGRAVHFDQLDHDLDQLDHDDLAFVDHDDLHHGSDVDIVDIDLNFEPVNDDDVNDPDVEYDVDEPDLDLEHDNHVVGANVDHLIDVADVHDHDVLHDHDLDDHPRAGYARLHQVGHLGDAPRGRRGQPLGVRAEQ